MILGVGAPRFIYTTGSVDFTETGHYTMKKKEVDSKDIIRNSEVTDDTKFIEIGSYLAYEYVFYNKSKTQIDNYKTMFGKEIQFFPHSDQGVSYSALCTQVRAVMTDGNALKYRVYISVISKNYFKFGTYIAVTSPNGAETVARNQVVAITWTSEDVTGYAGIELWKDGSKLSDIVTAASETVLVSAGTYNWTVAADAVIAGDYQIKVLNSTGYIYDLSDANFSITYDGYYLFDGTNDFVVLPFTSITGSVKSWGFWYNRNSAAVSGGEYLYHTLTTGATEYEYIVVGLNAGKVEYRKKVAAPITIIQSSINIPADAAWHYIVITVDHTNATANDRVKIYIDGTDRTAITTADDGLPYAEVSSKKSIGGLEGSSVSWNGSLKNCIITTDLMSVSNFGASAWSLLTNLFAHYRMNDADAGTPWTGNAVDSSTNLRNATPTNITGATFFNQS